MYIFQGRIKVPLTVSKNFIAPVITRGAPLREIQYLIIHAPTLSPIIQPIIRDGGGGGGGVEFFLNIGTKGANYFLGYALSDRLFPML